MISLTYSARARELLEQLRAQGRWGDEIATYARMAKAISARMKRLLAPLGKEPQE